MLRSEEEEEEEEEERIISPTAIYPRPDESPNVRRFVQKRAAQKIMNDIEITHEVQLTDLARARFVELEETVHVAIRSFIVLGDALREIR